MPFITSPVAGANLAEAGSEKRFAVGTVVNTSDGGQAIYVSATSTIATYDVVGILAGHGAVPLTTTNSATTKRVGFAQTSIASGYFGWVQISGNPVVKVAANCSDNVPLYTTGTAGVLDDAVVSGGLVLGVTLPTRATSVSNATAVTCVAAIGSKIGTGDMD